MREDMAEGLELLRDAPAFAGIPPQERAPLAEDVGAMLRRYRRDDWVRRAGERLDFYPVVVAGLVQATMPQGGQDLVVSQFGPGDSFAEAVPTSLERCPVDIRALEDTLLLCIPAASLDGSSNSWVKTLRGNLMGEMSKKVLTLSRALSVLGESRLSDRILAYLETLPQNADGSVTVPLSRKDWAGTLRVADKSLIRELKSMQDDGIIQVEGRTVRVLRRK